ncbi:GumC family protein [Roseivirga sp. BDSF3-8]|uniref:GumC family protein n=1 Tax=Roseivirga sp. BDSF3-8 TaxID=3241598 RepID=UPI003531F2B1
MESNTDKKIMTSKEHLDDVKKFLGRLRKRWYLFVISLGIALLVAFLINRYTSPVYPVTSSILVKGSNDMENSIGQLLYGNRAGRKNLNNEILILKSYPLIYRTVKSLGFEKFYLGEGNFQSSEIYKAVPYEMVVLSEDSNIPYNQTFIIYPVDQFTFQFYRQTEDEDQRSVSTFRFGEEANYNGFKFTLDLKRPLGSYLKRKVIFIHRTTHDVTRTYQQKLRVVVDGGETSILKLFLQSTRPQKDIDFLDKLVELYLEDNLEEKNQNASRTIAFIDSQLDDISDSLQVIEQRMKNFKETGTPLGIQEEGLRAYGKIDAAEGELLEVRRRLDYYNYLQKYIEQSRGVEGLVVPSAIGVNDQVLQQLINQLVELQLEKEQLTKAGATSNPYVEILNKRMDELKKSLEENLRNLISSTRLLERDLRQTVGQERRVVESLPQAEQEYVNIKRVYDLSESLYLFLMEKRAEASISKASTTSDIIMVNPPMISGGKIMPQPEKNLIFAILLGLSIPLLIMIVMDYLNNKVRYKEDVAAITNIPFLGVIGHNSRSSDLVFKDQPKGGVAESFRSVRSNLQFFLGENGSASKTLLVTSSISGEGKTFCSVNLALVLSYSGKKVVIIGADMRRPTLQAKMGATGEKGLSNYLSDNADPDQIVHPTESPNLFIINSGDVPPNPSELLMKDKLQKLLERLRERFDFIVIDSPPMGLVTDALIISKYVDHTVFLVRQNYTPKELLQQVNELYESGKLNNVSILLNDVKVNSYGGSYGGYGGSYGYGYYEEGTGKKGLLEKIKEKLS